MPGVSGTWRDTAIFFNVPDRRHVADPIHGEIGQQPGPGDYAFTAPPYPYTPPQGREDFGSQEVNDTRGFQIDSTPSTHDPDRRPGLDYSTVDEFDTPGAPDWDILTWWFAVHNKDNGSSRKQNYSEKVLEFSDERYLSFRIPGLGAEATDAIPPEAGGGGRGLNGLSVNNPPLESYLGYGFWPGHTEQLVTDRKLYTRIIQRNDERAQTLNLPYFEKDIPRPKPGNQSTTPFTGLQRMVRSVSKIALQRRTPPVPGDIQAEMAIEDLNSPTVGAAFYG
jgi:hypothetical protein